MFPLISRASCESSTPPKPTLSPQPAVPSTAPNPDAPIPPYSPGLSASQAFRIFYEATATTASKAPGLIAAATTSVFTGSPIRTYVAAKAAFPDMPIIQITKNPTTGKLAVNGIVCKLGWFGPVRAIPSGWIAMVPTRTSDFYISLTAKQILTQSGYQSDGSLSSSVFNGVMVGVFGMPFRGLFQPPAATFNNAIRVHGWVGGYQSLRNSINQKGIRQTCWNGGFLEVGSRGTFGNAVWFSLYEGLKPRLGFIENKDLRNFVLGPIVQVITDLSIHLPNVIVGHARSHSISPGEAFSKLIVKPIKNGDFRQAGRNALAGYGLKSVSGMVSAAFMTWGVGFFVEEPSNAKK